MIVTTTNQESAMSQQATEIEIRRVDKGTPIDCCPICGDVARCYVVVGRESIGYFSACREHKQDVAVDFLAEQGIAE